MQTTKYVLPIEGAIEGTVENMRNTIIELFDYVYSKVNDTRWRLLFKASDEKLVADQFSEEQLVETITYVMQILINHKGVRNALDFLEYNDWPPSPKFEMIEELAYVVRQYEPYLDAAYEVAYIENRV